ncbi:hypothetical protein cypCar_00045926, partial [Cyprinus carpio]
LKNDWERLEQEINDLRRRDAELVQLSHTQDHIQFLQSFQSLSAPPESTDVMDDLFSSLVSSDDLRVSVHQLRDKLEDFCKKELRKISDRVTFTNIDHWTRKDFLQSMVSSKETCAAIIALHQNGHTCKKFVTKNIAPERTIYRIIKNFKERGSTAVKKSSGHPRVSSKLQDHLLLRSQLRHRTVSSRGLSYGTGRSPPEDSATEQDRLLLRTRLRNRTVSSSGLGYGTGPPPPEESATAQGRFLLRSQLRNRTISS